MLFGVAMSVLPYLFVYRLIAPLLSHGEISAAKPICLVAAIAVCMIPVSYTHLDVYQRQEIISMRRHSDSVILPPAKNASALTTMMILNALTVSCLMADHGTMECLSLIHISEPDAARKNKCSHSV